jgi:hypothetical protein
MYRRFLAPEFFPIRRPGSFSTAAPGRLRTSLLGTAACACAVFLAASGTYGIAQAITIDTGGGKGPVAAPGEVDREFRQVAPTHIDLSRTQLDPKARLQLIRDLQSEQGFANRPFPRGHKGLTLQANGKLEPAGVNYLNMVINEGLSAKPGTRVVVTDIKIDKSRIVLDFDGGPDARHRFLRHIQISAGGPMDDPTQDPSLISQSGDPAGSRITLAFSGYVPELTSAQVKQLLAPLISFDVKSPVQAYTDTLPTALKDAILSHKVLVGMNTDMVMFAMGQPNSKSREMDGQMPFEEWIYGTPPEEVDFVRINGNRVIRVEIAKPGQPLAIFTRDVVTPMLMTAGTPELAETKTRTIREGDVQIDPDKQEAAPPPTLRKPGETLPTDSDSTGVMRPVQFPKPHPDEMPGADPDEQSTAPPASTPPAQTASGQPQSGSTQPPSGAQPSSPAPQQIPASTAPPASTKQPPPAGSNQLVSAGTAGAITN